MRSKSVFALAAFVTIAVTPIAHALDYMFRKDLIAQGYTCDTDPDSGIEICEKPGAPSYECDANSICEPTGLSTLVVTHPRTNVSVAPSVGSAVSNPTTTSSPKAGTPAVNAVRSTTLQIK